MAIQLGENPQREDLNPIDQAKGILVFFQAKHPGLSLLANAEAQTSADDGQAGNVYNLDGVMSELMKIQLKPDTMSEETVFTLNTVSEISGKSYSALFRTKSLLKLVSKIQDVILRRKPPVS